MEIFNFKGKFEAIGAITGLTLGGSAIVISYTDKHHKRQIRHDNRVTKLMEGKLFPQQFIQEELDDKRDPEKIALDVEVASHDVSGRNVKDFYAPYKNFTKRYAGKKAGSDVMITYMPNSKEDQPITIPFRADPPTNPAPPKSDPPPSDSRSRFASITSSYKKFGYRKFASMTSDNREVCQTISPNGGIITIPRRQDFLETDLGSAVLFCGVVFILFWAYIAANRILGGPSTKRGSNYPVDIVISYNKKEINLKQAIALLKFSHKMKEEEALEMLKTGESS